MNIQRMKDDDETLDTFFAGRIRILQKKKGYRFSLDAPVLADFIQPERQDELLELGTGSGIISLLLSIKAFAHITALELQPSLANMAHRNVRLNRLEDRITIREGDLRSFSPGRKFDKIFSNPPYFKKGGGQISASREKAIARHELTCDLYDVMNVTAACLKPDGKAFFIYPCRQESYFLEAVRQYGLGVRCRRAVVSRSSTEPGLFLGEIDFSGGCEKNFPPLIIYQEDGEYTEEAEEIFRGRSHVKTDS